MERESDAHLVQLLVQLHLDHLLRVLLVDRLVAEELDAVQNAELVELGRVHLIVDLLLHDLVVLLKLIGVDLTQHRTTFADVVIALLVIQGSHIEDLISALTKVVRTFLTVRNAMEPNETVSLAIANHHFVTRLRLIYSVDAVNEHFDKVIVVDIVHNKRLHTLQSHALAWTTLNDFPSTSWQI